MQDYGPKTIRDVAQPTASFVAATVLEHKYLKNQLILNVAVVLGTATSVNLKVEYSHDNVTFYQRTIASENSSTGFIDYALAEERFKAGGNYSLEIPIKYNFIKVSVKGVGTLTTTTVGIESIVGIV